MESSKAESAFDDIWWWSVMGGQLYCLFKKCLFIEMILIVNDTFYKANKKEQKNRVGCSFYDQIKGQKSGYITTAFGLKATERPILKPYHLPSSKS